MIHQDLHRFIRPQSVAIIGASQTRGAIGNTAIKNFADVSFSGKVFGVNPRYEEVEGFPCYPSLTAIPDEIDVVIVAVASHLVESAIQDCVEKRAKYVVIFSSGFAEMGEEGYQKQNEILKLCRDNGVRVVGPNTMGAFNLLDRILLTFSPVSQTNFLPGTTGLVSQSGATGGTILNKAAEEKVGLTYVFTTGNQMDLTTLDFLQFLVEDEQTTQIGTYLEGVPDGNQLIQAGLKALHQHKPLIVLKSGHSDAGKKAALSHTASLTGSSQVFELAAKRAGITLVNDMEEMIDALKAFKSKKRPTGNRVATLVISGATGIMLADKLSDSGQELAELSERTKARLAEVVPSYCSLANPVDIGATLMGNPILFKHCVETLADAEEVDSIIVHLPVGNEMGGMKFAQDIIDVASQTQKPIVVATIGTEASMTPVRNFLNEQHVPAFNTLKSAAQAIDFLYQYERMYESHTALSSSDSPTTKRAVPELDSTAASVTEPEVKQLLAENGIHVPKGGIGKNWMWLSELSQSLRYPLVAKIVSPDIMHKSDIGGVILPIHNEVELKHAYESIMSNTKQHAPLANVHGIYLEEMIDGPFLEVIVGVTRDPVFGPVLLCGLGGIYVEVMKDVSQRLAPVCEQEALEMIQSLKSYPLFTGIRKGISYDVQAFAKTLSRISELAVSLGDSWSDFEINPLIVLPEGQGVVALDGLITLNGKEAVKH